LTTFLIQVTPLKKEFDPLAAHLQKILLERGLPAAEIKIQTKKLYRIPGTISSNDMLKWAEALLVDPVVESVVRYDENKANSSKKKPKEGFTIDVWPKTGVTDPVAETVEKGLKDLGATGSIKASTATRYSFPKLSNPDFLLPFAKDYLANELIHDIHIE
jgi:phosphoribosylformylglycinamidine (FGAM) synthase PurS component